MKLAALLLAAALASEPVNVKAGDPAPADGVWIDAVTAYQIREKRLVCEEQNRLLTEALKAKPQESKAIPSGYVIAGLVGVLLGAAAVGVAVAYASKK